MTKGNFKIALKHLRSPLARNFLPTRDERVFGQEYFFFISTVKRRGKKEPTEHKKINARPPLIRIQIKYKEKERKSLSTTTFWWRVHFSRRIKTEIKKQPWIARQKLFPVFFSSFLVVCRPYRFYSLVKHNILNKHNNLIRK